MLDLALLRRRIKRRLSELQAERNETIGLTSPMAPAEVADTTEAFWEGAGFNDYESVDQLEGEMTGLTWVLEQLETKPVPAR